ncbi:MAG: hypothetical protein GXO87_10150 [Chlorobi bacterium]|nr:hypothetical protein [Chlorobiota bacterium]
MNGKLLKYLIIITAMLFSSSNYFAQDGIKETWVKVEKALPLDIYIDTFGLDSYNGDDFYVWALQKYVEPFEMEGIDDDIYSVKTFYLFSKKMKMYSIVQIIFYDDKSNVLATYSYDHDTNVQNYKYNYPVMPFSDIGYIFDKCLEFVGKGKK